MIHYRKNRVAVHPETFAAEQAAVAAKQTGSTSNYDVLL